MSTDTDHAAEKTWREAAGRTDGRAGYQFGDVTGSVVQSLRSWSNRTRYANGYEFGDLFLKDHVGNVLGSSGGADVAPQAADDAAPTSEAAEFTTADSRALVDLDGAGCTRPGCGNVAWNGMEMCGLCAIAFDRLSFAVVQRAHGEPPVSFRKDGEPRLRKDGEPTHVIPDGIALEILPWEADGFFNVSWAGSLGWIRDDNAREEQMQPEYFVRVIQGVAFRLEREAEPILDIPDGFTLAVFSAADDWLQVKWRSCLGWIKHHNVQKVRVNVLAQHADGHPDVLFRASPKGACIYIPNGTELHALRTVDDFVEVVWRNRKGWIKRSNVGLPWNRVRRTSCPPRHMPQIPSADYLAKQLPKLIFGRDGVIGEARISDEDIKETLGVFPLLDRNGSDWERSIFSVLDAKLQEWPQTCAKHGYSDEARWEIDSIRNVCNAKQHEAFDNIPTGDGEPVLAFHGTQLCHFRSILQDNFMVDTTGGWFGNGGYFTTCLPYAQHYIGGIAPKKQRGRDPDHGIMLPKVGNTVFIFAALLKPGTCEIIDYDQTPAGRGYSGKYRDAPKNPDKRIHSHLAFVAPPEPSNPFGVGFRPTCKDRAAADEYVIFDKRRVVPRFIVGLKRIA